jgi:release factor glutamine methyltransferase
MRVSSCSSGVATRHLRAWGLSRREAATCGKFIVRDAPRAEIRQRLLRRGRDREPLAYILGGTDFYGMRNFQISRPTLVPRPETEQFVDLIITTVSRPPSLFIDACCGSGAIAIALLRAWPDSRAIAIDCAGSATDLTSSNAKMFGVADRLTVLNTRIEEFAVCDLKVELLVSNPPYIPSVRMATLQPEIFKWEDHAALDGGSDGLQVTNQLMSKFQSVPEIWLEVDSESAQAETLVARHTRESSEVFSDWFGHSGRFVRFINS